MSRQAMSFALPESMREYIDNRDVARLRGERQDVAAILGTELTAN